MFFRKSKEIKRLKNKVSELIKTIEIKDGNIKSLKRSLDSKFNANINNDVIVEILSNINSESPLENMSVIDNNFTDHSEVCKVVEVRLTNGNAHFMGKFEISPDLIYKLSYKYIDEFSKGYKPDKIQSHEDVLRIQLFEEIKRDLIIKAKGNIKT